MTSSPPPRRIFFTHRTRNLLRADADLDLVIDAFIGTALARVTLLDRPLDAGYSERLVNLLLDGAAAR